MTENLKNFSEKLSSDSAMIDELEAALKDVPDEELNSCMIAFAKEKGFELSQEDFTQDTEELDLSELDSVIGAGGCGCAGLGGGGNKYGAIGNDGLYCRCSIIGFGRVSENGHEISRSQGACYCPAAGAGATRRH